VKPPPTLNSPNSVDESLSDEDINLFSYLKELLPEPQVAMIEERFQGKGYSEDYLKGLMSGYLHARDVYVENKGHYFVGWMNCIATFLAREICPNPKRPE